MRCRPDSISLQPRLHAQSVKHKLLNHSCNRCRHGNPASWLHRHLTSAATGTLWLCDKTAPSCITAQALTRDHARPVIWSQMSSFGVHRSSGIARRQSPHFSSMLQTLRIVNGRSPLLQRCAFPVPIASRFKNPSNIGGCSGKTFGWCISAVSICTTRMEAPDVPETHISFSDDASASSCASGVALQQHEML